MINGGVRTLSIRKRVNEQGIVEVCCCEGCWRPFWTVQHKVKGFRGCVSVGVIPLPKELIGRRVQIRVEVLK